MDIETGWYSEITTALTKARSEGKGVLLQFHRDECAGCRKMYASTYPDPDVEKELIQWFIPLRQDIFKNREVRSKYSAYWTPSFYFVDTRGYAQYTFNGYLGAEDFRVLMRLGQAALDFPRGKYLQIINLMDDGLSRFASNPKAATMLFVRGMAEYLLTKEKSSFRGTMQEIIQLYPDSLEARMWPWSDEPS